jgi:hypothetical protein
MKITRKLGLVYLFLTLALCSGCGYTFSDPRTAVAKRATLSVPYVIGDQDGTLTAAIIREVVRSGAFAYRDSGGTYLLKVEQLDISEEHIGFRYDRKKKGALTDEIIPTETRIISLVEIALIESGSERTLIGPARLSASMDYDHDYYFSRHGVNIFSLGQLTDIDTAYEAVQTPLNDAVAQKIVAYISQSW